MADHSKKGAMRFYIIIAVILMAITYAEFAIVEFTIPGLTTFLTVLLLIGLSLIKFALVVAIYMHLRDDDPLYTGFFSSGLVIAIGTFIALTFLFTVSSVMNAQSVTTMSAEEEVGAGEEVLEPGAEVYIEMGQHALEELSAERPQAEDFRVPAPKRQGLNVPLPAAQATAFSLKPVSELDAEESVGNSEESMQQEAAQETNSETILDETTTDAAAEATSEATTSEEATNEETSSEETSSEEASSEASGGEEGDMLAQAAFDWRAIGETTYSANCVSCHQANGQGIPGAFPPLAGHMPELYNAEGGRDYIIQVVLYGLQGEIDVDGTTYNGVMTPWGQLSDEQIAATLNHELTSWDNESLLEAFSPLTPDEVAALRDKGLSGSQVRELRPDLP